MKFLVRDNKNTSFYQEATTKEVEINERIVPPDDLLVQYLYNMYTDSIDEYIGLFESDPILASKIGNLFLIECLKLGYSFFNKDEDAVMKDINERIDAYNKRHLFE